MNICILEPKNADAFKRLIVYLYRFGVRTIKIMDNNDEYIRISGLSNSNIDKSNSNDGYIQMDCYKNQFTQLYINNAIPININICLVYNTIKSDSFGQYSKLELMYYKNYQHQYILKINVSKHGLSHTNEHKVTFNTEPTYTPIFSLIDVDAHGLINTNELRKICKTCKTFGSDNIKMTVVDHKLKIESASTNVQYGQIYNNTDIHQYGNIEHNISGVYNINYLLEMSEFYYDDGNKAIYIKNNSPLIIVHDGIMGQTTTVIYPYGTAIDDFIESEGECDDECENECENEYENDYNMEILI